ncbi:MULTISPECIES: hypothetical protein [Micrococcaceae]|uniref:hypothetical protein n=1 Tax=Micrococcaceae TaxID=1268 RepID=UPI00161750CD|nr:MULTISPECIES: hypothetical protein [Micrococcaceae]MBB5750005.1 hypothetical protein [Micrococcus sp. TA1]HRO30700.1 hypothetical protein [Citricoccus sp.]HRO94385.1 hypothetical protein [Citricoccus sp.]
MTGLEDFADAADVLAWVSPGIGLPLFVLGMLLRSTDRGFVPTQIVIMGQPHQPRARWFTAEDIYERRLRAPERARLGGRDHALAYVSPDKPTLMSLGRRRPITSVCLSLGATLIVIGVGGLVLSLIRAFTL